MSGGRSSNRESKRGWTLDVGGVEVHGVWRAPYWHVRFSLRGRRYKKTTKRTMRLPAQAEARRIVGALTTARSVLDLGELFDDWLGWQLLHLRKRPLSVRYDRSRVHVLVTWLAENGVRTVNELDRDHLEAFRVQSLHAGRSAKTVNNYLTVAKAATRWALHQGVIERDPLDGLELIPARSVNRRFVRTYSQSELRTILTAASDLPSPFMEAVLLAAYAGLRRSEICNLKVGDIERNGGQMALRIEQGKSVKPRLVPVHHSLVALIARLSDARPLESHLLQHHGHQLKFGRLGAVVSQMIRNLGITGMRYPLHTLRHTFASRLLIELRQPESVVMELMGHRDSKTLRQYTHVQRQDKADAIAQL